MRGAMRPMTPGETGAAGREWRFLGLRVRELSSSAEPVIVAEAVLPEGASPALHLHEKLDDSFYLLEGEMVIRCGEEVTLATSGAWVPFPRGVPHTFRVMDDRVRVLMVHADDSFLGAVRAIGRPADDPEAEEAAHPSPEWLAGAMAKHDIRTVGPPIEAEEADAWRDRLRQEGSDRTSRTGRR
jgi:mannose-6-phosphate isomerase-like protein (cupin superfamily)